MSKKTKLQNVQLNALIIAQDKQIQKIQDNIEKILATNEQLKDFRELQDKIIDFRKENNSNSKFRKILRIIPTIKHSLIASTNEKIDRRILETHKRLQEIDAVIVKMGQQSSTLQKIVKEEIAITAHTVQKKLVNSIASEVVNNAKNKLNELKLSPEEWKKAAIRVYSPHELRELENQSLALLGIRANINELLNNNANIPQLPTLQKELNVTLNSLHKSFGEHIKDLWSKIKSVFKSSNTQKLQKNTLKNSKVISDIDKNLEEILIKVEKSVKLRRTKLESQLSSMARSKGYQYHQYTDLTTLMDELDKLDTKFASALMDAGKSVHLTEQPKPISHSADLPLSTSAQDHNNIEHADYMIHPSQQTNDNQTGLLADQLAQAGNALKKVDACYISNGSAPNLQLNNENTLPLNTAFNALNDDKEAIKEAGITIKNAVNQLPQQQTTNTFRNTLPKMQKKSNLER